MVLIIGASGGVGKVGSRPVGRSGPRDRLHAQEIVDGDHRYDAIVDSWGNRCLSVLRRTLAPRGRLVIVGGELDGRCRFGLGRPLMALLLSRLVSQTLRSFIASENSDDLRALRDLIESGQVGPAIDRTYPLSEIAAAIR